MPVYNGEKYLESSIGSVLRSTYRNFELILVNDGSTDKSADICRKFSRMDGRVKLAFQENRGIAAARNRGLEEAEGEYVAFCDQDDYMHPDLLACLAEAMERDQCQYAMCSVARFIEGREGTYLEYGIEDALFAGEDQIRDAFIRPALFYVGDDGPYPPKRWSVWGCLFRRDIIDRYGVRFFCFMHYEDDKIFTLEYLKHASRASLRKRVLYFWRYNPESESSVLRHRDGYFENMESYQRYVRQYAADVGLMDGYDRYCDDDAGRMMLALFDNEIVDRSKSVPDKIKSMLSMGEGANLLERMSRSTRKMTERERLYFDSYKSGHYYKMYFFAWISLKMANSPLYKKLFIRKHYRTRIEE